MNKIILNDASEFTSRWCGVANGILSMCIEAEQSFSEVARLFDDGTKTQKIVFAYGEMRDEFDGFTDLAVVNRTGSEYLISLRKG